MGVRVRNSFSSALDRFRAPRNTGGDTSNAGPFGLIETHLTHACLTPRSFRNPRIRVKCELVDSAECDIPSAMLRGDRKPTRALYPNPRATTIPVVEQYLAPNRAGTPKKLSDARLNAIPQILHCISQLQTHVPSSPHRPVAAEHSSKRFLKVPVLFPLRGRAISLFQAVSFYRHVVSRISQLFIRQRVNPTFAALLRHGIEPLPPLAPKLWVTIALSKCVSSRCAPLLAAAPRYPPLFSYAEPK